MRCFLGSLFDLSGFDLVTSNFCFDVRILVLNALIPPHYMYLFSLRNVLNGLNIEYIYYAQYI